MRACAQREIPLTMKSCSRGVRVRAGAPPAGAPEASFGIRQPPLQRKLLGLQRADLGGAARERVHTCHVTCRSGSGVEQPTSRTPPTARRRTKTRAARRSPRATPCRVRRGPRFLRRRSSTLITLVVPGRLTAVPAVMTTRSPSERLPLARATSSECSQSSSISRASGDRIGPTPHSSAIWRQGHSVVRQPDYRPARPQPGHRRRRAAS